MIENSVPFCFFFQYGIRELVSSHLREGYQLVRCENCPTKHKFPLELLSASLDYEVHHIPNVESSHIEKGKNGWEIILID